MNTPPGFDQCLRFVNSQLHPGDPQAAHAQAGRPKHAVTISRQSGCGAHALAEKLAALLQSHSPPDAPQWTIFDNNLVERVLQDHHLPARLAQLMPEDRVSVMDEIMRELFGIEPSPWNLVQAVSETILQLADLGNTIILGRGGNIITAQLPHVVHVRLMSSQERRVENMQHFEHLDKKEALKRIHDEDLARQRYVRANFQKDVDDPLLYHLAINMDLVSMDEAARVIADLALHHQAAAPQHLAAA